MASFRTAGRKIIAIGRNYADHAAELNNAIPKEPFFFLKPTSSYLDNGSVIECPRGVDVHHEIELGVVIGKNGREVPPSEADSYIAGYALAIDLTARNMQNDVKKKGLPWSAAKGFDTFNPVSQFIPRDRIADAHNLDLWLKINGTIKQNGNTSDMLFRIPRLIQHVSSIMRLEEGDLLLTGTPAGVGPVRPGDSITAGLKQGGEQIAFLEHTAVLRQSGYHFEPSA